VKGDPALHRWLKFGRYTKQTYDYLGFPPSLVSSVHMLSSQVNSSNLCNGIYTQTQSCKGHYYEITLWIRTILFIFFKERKNELENSFRDFF